MRVLFWSEAFWPCIGGAEVLALELVRGLAGRGHEFRVCTTLVEPDLPAEDEYAGVPIHRFPFWSALSEGQPERALRIRRRVAELKAAYRPDLVHVSSIGLSVFFQLATAAGWPAPMLITLNGHPTSQGAGPDALQGRALRSADWVACCSRSVLDETRRLVPEVADRSCVVHNGLAAPRLEPAPLPFDPPRLLCLGRLIPEKGFDVALAALAALLPRFPDVRMTIIGDGPARADLEALAGELGLGASVEFTGWVAPPDVPVEVNRATVVIVPSRWEEPFGLVALEAAFMERPVAASRVGGLPEVVLDGETGLLVEKENAGALADAIASLLGRPEEAVQLGRAARRRAESEFSLDRLVDDYDRLYAKLTA